ncbi:MAG: mitochondrial fission ELM1 family protein [Pseudomarimonas sp.]
MSAPRVWVITDGVAGNVRQAMALAPCLGEVTKTLALTLAAPWRWLAPRQLPLTRSAFGAEFSAALGTGKPDIVVGCGRKAALATRFLRQHGVRSVQILAPRISTRHWDVVVTPAHDGISGNNVIQTLGSLHPIDSAWLERARREWSQLGELPNPRTVVLLGGPTKDVPLAEADWQELVATLRSWKTRDGGSLLLSSSRRTPDWLRQAARRELADLFDVQWHDVMDGANPYAGLLGWADRLVVSADSVNLLSEACATHVPVFVRLPAQASGRIAAFHQGLIERGRITTMHDLAASGPAGAVPVQELAEIVAAVRNRLYQLALPK